MCVGRCVRVRYVKWVFFVVVVVGQNQRALQHFIFYLWKSTKIYSSKTKECVFAGLRITEFNDCMYSCNKDFLFVSFFTCH
jgi:hypothetical protein